MSEMHPFNEELQRKAIQRARAVLKEHRKGKTVQQLADKLGVSRQRVYQLIDRAENNKS
jgi:transposase